MTGAPPKTGPGAVAKPVRFLLAGGVAALANFLARIAFSAYWGYAFAIVLAYVIGLATAFVLNREFVFKAATSRLHEQAFWFVVINLLGLVQTLAVSLLLARSVLPKLGITAHAEALAHAAGIAVPLFTSYIGHHRLTFR